MVCSSFAFTGTSSRRLPILALAQKARNQKTQITQVPIPKMTKPLENSGSFRDPSGWVFEANGEIFRTVREKAVGHYEFVKGSGLLEDLVEKGQIVTSQEIDRSALGKAAGDARLVLRHSRIPFISYPYEWSFSLLKSAALLHLDVQIAALERGVSLSDASAYNVQFDDIKPLFIDILSFRQYEEGELWAGHRQFCEQFLNPLLLRSMFGIPHNDWFRGSLEGIDMVLFANLISGWRKFSPNLLSHVIMPAKMQNQAISHSEENIAKAKKASLPKQRYMHILQQLHHWITGLTPKDSNATTWQNYELTHTYNNEEEDAKQAFVGEFCAKVNPDTLWDIGCNSGEYSEVALSSGAGRVIGFDFDQGALEHAHNRARDKNLNLLSLFQDGAHPSPDQGWNMSERRSAAHRGGADALVALAFEHHLAIGKNIPLDRVVKWLVSLAPQGIIEFVQKSDTTVQRMLALREDIFDQYSQESFEAALTSCAKTIESRVISKEGRTLYWFARK